MERKESESGVSPWMPDPGDGTYRNPVLHADYSDPDAILVNGDFYMTSSSFHHIPGLPILHSRDLVNWRLIGHALRRMPLPGYGRPQHGRGVWAPSIRHHAGKFWIFYGDPDVGIFMTTAEDPAGEWSPLHLVQAGKGLIDPCPLWDEDGRAYLVHAFAESRSGIRDKLRVCPMDPEGRRIGEGRIVFDDPVNHPTIEGPKFYKRNGYYYIFAPAGGVPQGWQTVLRASSPYGPYEDRIVLRQGGSPVNGPHQGGWVELENGESWFLHFQDKDAYGRIVHLQPVAWENDWPRIGEPGADGVGTPVLRFRKPAAGVGSPVAAPAATDEFAAGRPGLQWQWQANPSPEWTPPGPAGGLRLRAMPLPEGAATLYDAPHLLLQKFPAPAFEATVELDVAALKPGDEAGLVVFGFRHARLAAGRARSGDRFLAYTEGDPADERVLWRMPLTDDRIGLRVSVAEGAVCRFAYRSAGEPFRPVDAGPFEAAPGRWVGAKVGLFAAGADGDAGYAAFGPFRVTP